MSTPEIAQINPDNSIIGAVLQEESLEGESYWAVVITNKIDYESIPEDVMVFEIEISVEGDSNTIFLYVQNIDDNAPIIVVVTNPCQIEVSKH